MNTHEQEREKGRGGADVSYLGKTVDQMIWEFMEAKQIPGLTLAIVQAPYIPRVVGYGLADMEQKRLASAVTMYPAGPISQAFAAVAIMQLQEAGKVDLEKRLDVYLQDVPRAWGAVTLLQLLRHSTGIADYRLQQAYNPVQDVSFTQLVNMVRDIPLKFAPGTDVDQSATNFLLLTEVIEKVSGVTYHDFVTEHQIRFLNLRHTCFAEELPALNPAELSGAISLHDLFKRDPRFVDTPEAATGYDESGNKTVRVRSSAVRGFADIWASAKDISFWDICLAGSILVHKPENRKLLYAPFALENGKTVPAVAGWQFYHHCGLMDLKGGVPGFSVFLSRFTDPGELVCVTLMGNKEGVDFTNLGRRIARAFSTQSATGYDDNRLALYECVHGVAETVERLRAGLERRRIPVFAEFDHDSNAEKVNLELRPTRVIVFGAPAVGTKLMQQSQSMALELPLRIAIWEDEKGSTWLAFPRLELLAQAYGLEGNSVVGKMTGLLEGLAAEVSTVY